MCRWMRVVLPLMMVFLIAIPAMAQPTGTPPAAGPTTDSRGDPMYGVTTYITQTLSAFEFTPLSSTNSYSYALGTGTRYGTTPGGTFWLAPLHGIPAGAIISGIELMGCDTNASLSMTAGLYSNVIHSGVLTETGHGSVVSGSGCGYFGGLSNITPTVVVDNYNRTYYVQISQPTSDSSTRFASVRIYYRLAVSTAPGVATFTDVPTTHPFFRFVEAMVSSGLTGGCGNGNFCPDTPVTRGQLAVFLSTALGLHHPL